MITTNTGSIPVRLITLNIRYATEHPGPGEEPWSVRCQRLCAQLRFVVSGHDSPFVCLQEVLHSQLTDIQTRLGTSWEHIGRGREDGNEAGEYSPIFFRADHWECERNRTYWLSPTPEVPSKGWDAALERVVTMGCFRHRRTSAVVVIMSTHLDHRGEVAREESARLLLRLARAWSAECSLKASHPVLLGGDFNSTPTGRAYRAMTEPGSGMKDVSNLVPEEAKYGNQEMTFTSFGDTDEQPKRIDFLFVSNAESLCFKTFAILPNKFDDGIYLSDHRPVISDIEIPVKVTV
ncbi:Endonuclease/exonuclease/phosphatase [Corynascus novoguineensis]|uniref:Endonuclease/exonuclease/phosphatase n=1 Tax=Corynascus novoguineensis TaxID=1126955 RepID=A0AAN7HRX9_9PEZI|nr:Endonuclease/exonuclease/phosphatase [Corynascus novoguineensis]